MSHVPKPEPDTIKQWLAEALLLDDEQSQRIVCLATNLLQTEEYKRPVDFNAWTLLDAIRAAWPEHVCLSTVYPGHARILADVHTHESVHIHDQDEGLISTFLRYQHLDNNWWFHAGHSRGPAIPVTTHAECIEAMQKGIPSLPPPCQYTPLGKRRAPGG